MRAARSSPLGAGATQLPQEQEQPLRGSSAGRRSRAARHQLAGGRARNGASRTGACTTVGTARDSAASPPRRRPGGSMIAFAASRDGTLHQLEGGRRLYGVESTVDHVTASVTTKRSTSGRARTMRLAEPEFRQRRSNGRPCNHSYPARPRTRWIPPAPHGADAWVCKQTAPAKVNLPRADQGPAQHSLDRGGLRGEGTSAAASPARRDHHVAVEARGLRQLPSDDACIPRPTWPTTQQLSHRSRTGLPRTIALAPDRRNASWPSDSAIPASPGIRPTATSSAFFAPPPPALSRLASKRASVESTHRHNNASAHSRRHLLSSFPDRHQRAVAGSCYVAARSGSRGSTDQQLQRRRPGRRADSSSSRAARLLGDGEAAAAREWES